jgi:hypothetical protein
MRMHILMAATATVRPQEEVPMDGRFEFQAVHCLPTAVLPSGLYQPARSIFHLMKVITANTYIYMTRTVRQDGDA